MSRGPDAARRSNRGFWLVAGAIGAACVFLVVEIVVNRPIKDSIAHAEATLRDAQATVETVRAGSGSGSVASADAAAMSAADPGHTYRDGASVSTGLDDVSVATREGAWAAAVQARPGACFYLRLTDGGDVFYGVGTVCSGDTALGASDPEW